MGKTLREFGIGHSIASLIPYLYCPTCPYCPFLRNIDNQPPLRLKIPTILTRSEYVLLLCCCV